MQTRRVLAASVALLIAAGPAAFAQRNNDRQQAQQTPQRSAAQQQDTETLVRLVEAVAAGQQPAPADIAVTWDSNHFVKGQGGDTYIPFTITIDRAQLASPAAMVYVRVVDKNQAAASAAAPAAAPAAGQNENAKGNDRDSKEAAPAPPPVVRYAWDNIYALDVPADGRLQRAIQLKPGEYDVFIAVKDKTPEAAAPQGNQRNQRNAPPAAAAATPAKLGLLRRDLTVPDFNVPDLKTSTVILATAVEPMGAALSPLEQEANPYVFGPMRIVPSRDAKFAKSGELQVIFWIYGAAAADGGKPDVTIDYNFHQRLPEGEKYFNRTQPQALNGQTLPPEFSVAAGHQLPGSLVVPVSAFPAGDYRLEIKVTDKASGKTVTENVNFTVLPV